MTKKQLCPKCQGQGVVSRPPWLPADIPVWTSHTVGPYVCDVCNGFKVVNETDPTVSQNDDDYMPNVFCPFSSSGRCPSSPPCTNPRERVCVNGFQDE